MASLRPLILLALSILSAAIVFRFKSHLPRVIAPVSFTTMSTSSGTKPSLPKTQEEWRKALDDLPARTDKIPAFFFGHGSPMLAFPEKSANARGMGEVYKAMGPTGPLGTFLKDFGPALLRKYNPKGIVVFSAHWETQGERLGMSSMSSTAHIRYIEL